MKNELDKPETERSISYDDKTGVATGMVMQRFTMNKEAIEANWKMANDALNTIKERLSQIEIQLTMLGGMTSSSMSNELKKLQDNLAKLKAIENRTAILKQKDELTKELVVQIVILVLLIIALTM